MLTISFCVIARNEEKALPHLLEDLLGQTFPKNQTEVLLIDSMSNDKTEAIMQAFAASHGAEYHRVEVLPNPGRILAAGWNVALEHFTGDAILRVDAHASIPAEFIEKNAACLMGGEKVCGGRRPCVPQEKTPWQKTLLLAENSLFGSSIAPYRRSQEHVYVQSLFHGCYRREVFETVGGYNEELVRTEDNEMNYRIRAAGYRLCYDPNILSWQYVRSSLRGMIRQKYGNGKWIALTAGVCPACLSLYHFVPGAFLFGIVLTTILALCGWPLLGWLMWGLYALLCVVMTLCCVKDVHFTPVAFCMPVLFLLLHVTYGVGTWVGFCQLPFWKKKHHGGQSRRTEEIRCLLKERSTQKEGTT